MHLTRLSILVVAGTISFAVPAFASPALTVAEADFSAGPGADYGPAKKLVVGTHVDVIWCGTHANWCLVDIHNKKGWVPLASLTFKLPRVVTLADDGTPNGGPAGPASGPAGGPTKGPASATVEKMAQPPSGGGGSGIKFSPVNNYSVVKAP